MALLHFLFEMVMWFACKAINTTVAIATCTLWCIIYAYALCEFTVQGLNWLLFDSWQPCTEQLSSTSDDPQQVLHPAASVSDSIMDCAASCLADRPLLHRKDPSCLPFDARRAMFEPVSADQGAACAPQPGSLERIVRHKLNVARYVIKGVADKASGIRRERSAMLNQ